MASERNVRLLIAHAHKLVREGLRALVVEGTGLEVVAEVADGHEAAAQAKRARADVALVDVSLRGVNGLDVIQSLATAMPAMRCVLLSADRSDAFALQALRRGAAGYLLKDASGEDLRAALRTVARGETYLSQALSRRVITALAQGRGNHRSPFDLLTTRQREVLQLLAEGGSTKEIAFHLGVSGKTIETHRQQIMRRLAITDVAGLVRYAIRSGLVEAD